MKLGFRGRAYRARAASPAIEPPADDALDLLAEMEALAELDVLAELDALQSVDETVQEIAEQTSYGEILLDELIRRQLALSLRVALSFLLVLFSLPLLNLLAPRLMSLSVLGLPLRWLLLAILVYPLLWLLGAYFVTAARKHEEEFTRLVRK